MYNFCAWRGGRQRSQFRLRILGSTVSKPESVTFSESEPIAECKSLSVPFSESEPIGIAVAERESVTFSESEPLCLTISKCESKSVGKS